MPYTVVRIITYESKREYNFFFSASKQRQQLSSVSELSDEIRTLEERINNADSPEPHIVVKV